jgi:pilus assembly protein CpaE
MEDAPQLLVVDPDLVWRTQLANVLAPAEVDDVPSLSGALALLRPQGPVGLVVGPGAAAEVLDRAAELRANHPGLAVVLVVESVSVSFLQLAMRAGVADVIDAHAPADQLASSLRDALVPLGAGTEAVEAAVAAVAPARLIVVTTAKGGEGATTVATNLAVVLADEGARSVVLVEGDPRFGDVALAFGLPPGEVGRGFDDLATDRQQILAHLRTHEPTGVLALLPPRSTAPVDRASDQHVIEIISAVQAIAHTVIVDAPFRLVELADLLTYADRVLLVTDTDAASLKNSMIAVQVMGRAGSNELVELVVNRHDPSRRSGPDLDDVQALVGAHVLGALPPDEGLAGGWGDGLPLSAREPNGRFARAIRELTAALERPRTA